jgi:hypothetical protein
MLRITAEEGTGGELRLHLAGRIVGPWVEELRKACLPRLASGRRLTLDLAQVSFLDQAAVELCSHLRAAGAELGGSSAFIQELLAHPPAAADPGTPADPSVGGERQESRTARTFGGNEP